ncbi:uncharacterized protein VTP21DRAFT_10814, partial [Calcarisporiella thermophila]
RERSPRRDRHHLRAAADPGSETGVKGQRGKPQVAAKDPQPLEL